MNNSETIRALLRAKNNDVNQMLRIWDGVSPALEDANRMVLWRSFELSSHMTSIPLLLEINAERLRALYLAWVHDLGEASVHGARVVDHLCLRPGFSYWWMTKIAEKCNYEKSPLINDAIKFMAFEEWAQGQQINGVELATANHVLAECMRVWCAKKTIPFTLRRLQNPKIELSWLRRIFGLLPLALQALVWLTHYLLVRWPLRGVGLKEWRTSPGRVTLVSYLFNLVPEATAQGRFESRYWGPLPEVLQAEDCATNWLHIYVKDALLPTAKEAAELLRTWNKAGQGLQCHVVLDTFLGVTVVLRTLRDWGRLMLASIRMRRWLLTHHRPDSHLWRLVVEDWRQSIFGITALNNLLFLNLLESAFEGQPLQDHGVYLQENQGWEFSLIHAWTAAGHGRLIGYPHSCIRFWDLRYFFDTRSYCRTGNNDLPLPHKVACNGPAMRLSFEEAGYPSQDIVDVEALRYLQLLSIKKKDRLANNSGDKIQILVLGDYLKKNMQLQMHLLEKAMQLLEGDVTLLVKPHPACPIYIEDYPNITLQISTKPIFELLKECDVAYSSTTTSGAVDTYCSGMPTVVALDPSTLNMSPLRGYDGVIFVSTPVELAVALVSANLKSRGEHEEINFFNLDSRVDRWKRLLHNSSPLKT